MNDPNSNNGGRPAAAPNGVRPIDMIRAKSRGLLTSRQENPAPQENNAVNSAPQAAAPADVPKLPKKIAVFKEIIRENPREGAVMSLLMVSALMKNTYRPDGFEVSAMGFDPDYMKKLMRAIFCDVKKRNVKVGEINHLFNRMEPTLAIIHKSLLGLSEESTPAEVESKLNQLIDVIEQFPQLAEYGEVRRANRALYLCNEVEKRKGRAEAVKELGLTMKDAPARLTEEELSSALDGLSEEELRQKVEELRQAITQTYGSEVPMNEEELNRLGTKELKMKIIKHLGFGAPVTFEKDKLVVDQVIEDAEEGKLSNIDATEFCLRNLNTPPKAFKHLARLREAFAASEADYKRNFQHQHFNGAEKGHVINALSGKIPSIGMVLMNAVITENSDISVLSAIVDHFDTKSDNEMKAVLANIFDVIDDLYPELRDADDLVRLEREKKWDKELMTYYTELFQSAKAIKTTFDANPESASTLDTDYFHPLLRLHGALLDRDTAEKPDDYNTRFKDQFFDKDDLGVVMARISQELKEDGVVEKLQAVVAKLGQKDNAGMLKAIARVYGHLELDDAFKANVEKVSDAIAEAYPETDPIPQTETE